MKHARLFSTDQKLFVECNKEERPVYKDVHPHWEESENKAYRLAKEKWQSNLKTIEVHPSEVKKFKHKFYWQIRDEFWKENENKKGALWSMTALEKWLEQHSLMLPPDSVRITEAIIPRPKTGMGVNHNEWKEYAFLSEESSETQEDWMPKTTEEAKTYLESEGINADQLVKEGLDFIETVKKRIELQKRWIPTSDLPKDHKQIFMCFENGDVAVGTYCDDFDASWWSDYFIEHPNAKVTHWMPYEVPSKY